MFWLFVNVYLFNIKKINLPVCNIQLGKDRNKDLIIILVLYIKVGKSEEKQQGKGII